MRPPSVLTVFVDVVVVVVENKALAGGSPFIVLKVREKDQQRSGLYSLVKFTGTDLSDLHAAIIAKLRKGEDPSLVGVDRLVLLPDVQISDNDELSLLKDGDCLEVSFSYERRRPTASESESGGDGGQEQPTPAAAKSLLFEDDDQIDTKSSACVEERLIDL